MNKRMVSLTAAWVATLAACALESTLAQVEEPKLPEETAPADPAAPAALGDESEGKTIKSIDVRFQGQGKVDKERILSRMSLKEGDKYSKDKEESDIKTLYQAGEVDNVSIEVTASGDGVRVVVTVQARAGMGEVTFLGNSAIETSKLRSTIDLKTGTTVEESKLQQARTDIEDLYRKKGYTDVTVNYTVEPAGNGFSRVVFNINEGQKGYLRNVQFEGNSSISARELRKLMKVDNRGIKFWTAPKLDQEKLDTDVRAIENYYQDRGFVNAKVTGYERVQVDAKKVDLMVRINEGQQFTVSAVTVSGAKAFQPEVFIPAFDLEAGKLFSGKNLKADLAKIRSYYGSRGYAEVKVMPQIKEAGGSQVSVNYAIEEGGIYKVNKINFSGNNATKDEVMRREMAITPGETYNQTTIDVSERRLKGLGYFKEITTIPSDSDVPGFKDININVTEQQTGQLNFGAGFSSIDNLVGFIDLRQTNFDIGSWPPVGAGQRFNLSLKIGTERKDAIVGWYDPWFLGHPFGFGTELYYAEKTYLSDEYDQTQVGGNIYIRKRINESMDWRLQYTGEQVTIDDIDEDSSELLKAEQGDYFHNELALTVNYDTRDDNVIPRKGLKVAAELSGAFGDFNDYGAGLSFSKPWLLPLDMIFTVTGSAGYVGDDPPIFEREFLGGANNLRGFKYRDVGPKDENGEPMGGDTSWFLSGELTFPIIERARGAVFYDVGEVSGGPGTHGGGVNSDYGIGLRLNLPVFGPLKLDYAFPVQSDEFNDSSGRFNISVDYKF
ncbi:MAG: outer membrane protein assembly factor BamA [Verrucomicrobiales bacterium]|nr:outer membrane protein assembly factor BamA [Verrucomicrobiales bacterium]